MTSYGFALSSEEHMPNDLVRYAAMAEEAGFEFAMISDHYHPWVDAQGHSPFVWSVIGGIAHATERLRLGTGVTAPIMRIHPAIIAQAAATAAAMMPGRFMLGVGTGENLNEHILAQGWPSISVRQEMLAEAVEVMRKLWTGENVEYYGEYYSVQDARLYTLPDQPPPVLVAASGKGSAMMAAEIGDGLVATAPNQQVLDAFVEGGGASKPKLGQVTVCWHEDEAEAKRIARKVWPNAAVQGELTVELPLPRHFEQATQDVTEDQIAKLIVCGPEPGRYVEKIREYEREGFDHVYVHAVGPDQEGFIRFFQREVMPELQRQRPAA
ncbi:MAG TPA: TIGR03557 family F420-dependent LLM class oxidoreductase [Dehalococcoidia bacterium]|nr:TIGR03557 family F420-dependent LLM class oxidoreductase [Dehalococcoidia bacterium]